MSDWVIEPWEGERHPEPIVAPKKAETTPKKPTLLGDLSRQGDSIKARASKTFGTPEGVTRLGARQALDVLMPGLGSLAGNVTKDIGLGLGKLGLKGARDTLFYTGTGHEYEERPSSREAEKRQMPTPLAMGDDVADVVLGVGRAARADPAGAIQDVISLVVRGAPGGQLASAAMSGARSLDDGADATDLLGSPLDRGIQEGFVKTPGKVLESAVDQEGFGRSGAPLSSLLDGFTAASVAGAAGAPRPHPLNPRGPGGKMRALADQAEAAKIMRRMKKTGELDEFVNLSDRVLQPAEKALTAEKQALLQSAQAPTGPIGFGAKPKPNPVMDQVKQALAEAEAIRASDLARQGALQSQVDDAAAALGSARNRFEAIGKGARVQKAGGQRMFDDPMRLVPGAPKPGGGGILQRLLRPASAAAMGAKAGGGSMLEAGVRGGYRGAGSTLIDLGRQSAGPLAGAAAGGAAGLAVGGPVGAALGAAGGASGGVIANMFRSSPAALRGSASVLEFLSQAPGGAGWALGPIADVAQVDPARAIDLLEVELESNPELLEFMSMELQR